MLESTPVGDVLNPDEFEFQFATFTSAYMDVNFDGLVDKISGFGGGPLGVYIQEEPNFFQVETRVEHTSARVVDGIGTSRF